MGSGVLLSLLLEASDTEWNPLSQGLVDMCIGGKHALFTCHYSLLISISRSPLIEKRKLRIPPHLAYGKRHTRLICNAACPSLTSL
jgi:hypothetical protein